MIYPQIHLHIPVMLFCPHLNHLHCTNSFCSNILLFWLKDIIPLLSPLWYLLDLLSLWFSPPVWSRSLHSPCCNMVPTVPTWIADTLLVCPPVCLTSPPGHLISISKGTHLKWNYWCPPLCHPFPSLFLPSSVNGSTTQQVASHDDST